MSRWACLSGSQSVQPSAKGTVTSSDTMCSAYPTRHKLQWLVTAPNRGARHTSPAGIESSDKHCGNLLTVLPPDVELRKVAVALGPCAPDCM